VEELLTFLHLLQQMPALWGKSYQLKPTIAMGRCKHLCSTHLCENLAAALHAFFNSAHSQPSC